MLDLTYFVIILLVFIAAYGVSSQAILYPNTALSISLAKDVIRDAWWNMFGQLDLQGIAGNAKAILRQRDLH